MAFVTVSKPHLKKLASEGDRRAQKLLNLRSNPERVLSILQIGITLVGAVSAAVGGAGAEESLSPYFQELFGVSEDVSESLAIVSVVIPLTFFSVVIGELVPKTLALKAPMRFAKLGSHIIIILDKIFSPFVFALEFSTKLITNIFSSKISSSEKLQEIQSGTLNLDHLTEANKQYVFNLIEIDKRKLKDIMLPWEKVTKIESTMHYLKVYEIIKQSRHTRIPVVDQNIPMGILLTKDFISDPDIAKMNWNELIRPIIKLSSEQPILSALKVLQNQKSHMAAVCTSEEVLGVVTLEDILEEVVGDIYDEDDAPQVLLSSNARIRTLGLKK